MAKRERYQRKRWAAATNGRNSGSAVRVIPGGQGGITYDSVTDTTEASAAYEIINDAGYELPSTGGGGTAPLYLFGTVLIGLAGAGLAMRRKRKAA